VLNAAPLRPGLALANMGDIQMQTAAGAIQTGTHGTGRDIGGMAAQVAGLELVLADGTSLPVPPTPAAMASSTPRGSAPAPVGC
jgi:FAD/FMN-containing dehydrogenase